MGRHAVAAGAVAGLALIGLSGPAAWASPGSSHGHGSASSGGGSAPAGNNGHIQIDEYPMDGGNGNDPHVGCGFSISFFGYDSGPQTATVSVTPWAPTRGGTPFHGQTGWNAGTRTAGNQLDFNYPVPAATVAGIFQGVAPAHQGYHARIEVEVSGSQGSDDKYKMVWIAPCAGAAATNGASSSSGSASHGSGNSSDTSGSAVPASSTPAGSVSGTSAGSSGAVLGESVTRAASAPNGTSTPAAGASNAPAAPAAGTGSAPRTAVLGESVGRPLAAAPAGTVSHSVIAGLPFTGADIAGESAVALGLIGVGGFLTRRYRLRRR